MALLSFTLVTTLNLLDVGLSENELWFALGAQAVISALQLRHSAPGANRAPLWNRCLTLGVQALLTYLPLLVFRAEWGSMAGFLAGSLLLLLPPRIGWSLYGVTGISLLVPSLIEDRSVLDTVYLCQSTMLTGLITFGLSRLSELVKEVHAARGELAHMAVTEERLRFARDLHDLLGFSLSTITLKSELIHRLIPGHPERAMEEIEDVLTVARDSLADVRRVARGFQDMSLEREINSARSVLGAADIGVDILVDLGEVSPRSDSVLAAVLREAVTNVLRHSLAGHCAIEAVRMGERVRLTVVNDGVQAGYRDPSPDSGSGLSNLEARVRVIGGTIRAGRLDDRTFRLVAEVSAQPGNAQLPAGEGELTVEESAA
ncbi:sensor histidine kinase [Streptomyces coeruleorubidus]|uniref:sensor histidine kinase n=1 Tax=Streptomyces coeruleorubidus TaxID=116188 RepID=UPI0037AEBF15